MAVQQMTSFEISRPVLSGGEDLLNATRRLGQSIFGEDTTNGIVTEEGAVGNLRFDTYGKLVLPLVQIAAPIEADFSNLFYYGAQRLQDQRNPAESLRTELNHLGLSYGVTDQNNVIVRCDAITISSPPHKQRQELALVPDPADNIVSMFIGEHELLTQAMHRNVRLRNRLGVNERYTPVFPFGLLPEDVTADEKVTVLKALKKYLPVRLVLGTRSIPMIR